MIGYFYDIESLENVFSLVNFKDDTNTCDIYYLIDNEDELIVDENGNPISETEFLNQMKQRIYDKNKNFKGNIKTLNLKTAQANIELAKTFGVSNAYYANNPDAHSDYNKAFRLKCDTDTDYDEEKDYYLFGYNSYHYDTTMLAMYLFDVIPFDKGSQTKKFEPTTARLMRRYNDELFSDQFINRMEDRLRYGYKNAMYPAKGYSNMNYRDPKALIRKNMLMSGRHLDVAKLNEKQQKVGLKRLLGMMGYQILESSKLKQGQSTIENLDQLLDLIAYNVSDCVNLKQLYSHKIYQSSFALKKQLLKDYPELIYDRKSKTEYKPNISPQSVRSDRLTIDSSSAQFSTKSLCPYDHLHDYDTVSFMYPSEAKAKDLGIPRVNVLEEARKFFYDHFHQPELREKFDEKIYNYYKSIEGKNFNKSENYLIDHGVDPNIEGADNDLPDELQPYDLDKIPAPNTCMFYYNKDGSPSSCFVKFSTGGIHGAEYNKELYEHDLKCYETAVKEATDEWLAAKERFKITKETYPDPRDLKIAKGIVIDGKKYTPSHFLKPKATKDHAEYKDVPAEPKLPKMPAVFKQTPKGGWKIDDKYTYTSADPTNHEDFVSYYPNMLRMMDAFFNTGLGYDRYGEIFDNKTKYGIYMKDKNRSEEERAIYSTMRNGTKLILNSASGAADANFDSNIRMNNKIISMRIIGQLFTWRIGQAQAIEGAKITSTNTDGLFSVLEATLNDEILARESESIHVEIEPEPIYLISKDSNNRMEVKIENHELTDIVNASGSTLACRNGPTPDKSLDHPAIIDWALAEYLILAATKYKDAVMNDSFSNTLGLSILNSARKSFNNDIKSLMMFQNVIASSPGSQRYIYAIRPTSSSEDNNIILQHYNRCFIMKDNTPDTVCLSIAAARKITDAMFSSRKAAGEKLKQNDPIASEILIGNGVNINNLPMDKEATILKIKGMESDWRIKICNEDLHIMPQNKIDEIFDNIDYEKYLVLLRDSFEKNWKNKKPEIKESDNNKPINLFADINKTESNEPESCDTNNPDINSIETPDINENTRSEIDIAAIMPKIYVIKKKTLTQEDIIEGEKQLNLGGVRIGEEHAVLVKILKKVFDTNIE